MTRQLDVRRKSHIYKVSLHIDYIFCLFVCFVSRLRQAFVNTIFIQAVLIVVLRIVFILSTISFLVFLVHRLQSKRSCAPSVPASLLKLHNHILCWLASDFIASRQVNTAKLNLQPQHECNYLSDMQIPHIMLTFYILIVSPLGRVK